MAGTRARAADLARRPQPLPRPAEPGLVTHGDGNWMLAGIGIAGAGIAAGGVAGLARRYRIRARRLAI